MSYAAAERRRSLLQCVCERVEARADGLFHLLNFSRLGFVFGTLCNFSISFITSLTLSNSAKPLGCALGADAIRRSANE
jgi:hypothetical protein